jgi:hypothetical protein
VIHLEKSNEWNLSAAKEGSSKKMRERGARIEKRGETSVEKLHILKKERG